jgi:hypothetical protein
MNQPSFQLSVNQLMMAVEKIIARFDESKATLGLKN